MGLVLEEVPALGDIISNRKSAIKQLVGCVNGPFEILVAICTIWYWKC